MPDEKKTYLVNVESNLDEYIKEATLAKEKVDELTKANKELKDSGTATASQIEASNSALRNAKKEYTDATKLVDVHNRALKSEAGSRKQLGEILKLQEQALGKVGNQIIVNAKGQQVLNPLLVEARNRVAATKQAILDYDAALKDGRSNVGRYGEAMKAAFADGVKNIKNMLGPMALVTAAIAGARAVLSGLKDAFFSTTQGINALKAASEAWKTIMYEIAVNKNIFPDTKSLEITAAAVKKLNDLRLKDAQDALDISEQSQELQELRLQLADADLLASERIKIMTEVQEKQIKIGDLHIENLKEELEAYTLLAKARPKDEALQMKLLEIQTRINEAEADKALSQIRNAKMLEKIREAEEKKWADWHDKLMEAAEEEIKKNKELAEERAKLAKSLADLLQEQKDEVNQGLAKVAELVNADIKRYNTKKKIDTETLKWNENVQAQNQRIIEQAIDIDRIQTETWVANRQIAADALGQLSQLLGQQTEAGKAFAIAQATINTYVGATQALRDPTLPSTFARIAMAATVILQGLNSVRQILAVDTSGKGASAPSPTSIVGSQAVQRSFADQTGSTIFTQPNLSQTQLNSIPNQNLLTAADITNAIKNLPAPVVTVEDINAKIISKRKVEVRATI